VEHPEEGARLGERLEVGFFCCEIEVDSRQPLVKLNQGLGFIFKGSCPDPEIGSPVLVGGELSALLELGAFVSQVGDEVINLHDATLFIPCF
jgi:hypothetical protein